jgi:hypothetical protein
MQDKGIHISGLAETNTDWHYRNIKQHITKKIQQSFAKCSVAFSANRFHPPDPSPYPPGGCMQICTGHWTGRIIRTIHDPRRLSRWIGHMYRLDGTRTLSVITAYRPCKQSTTDTGQIITATHQQQSLLYDDTGTVMDPRQVFMDDLTTLLQTIEENPNNSYILMWDANESIEDTTGAITKLMRETTITDVFSHIANKKCDIPTYTRGSKRIDFIFTSQNLLPYIKKTGYLAFYEANDSDHRGGFIDLEDSIIDKKVELKRPPRRNIGSKCKKKIIYRYKQEIHRQFCIHRIHERAEELRNQATCNPITPELLEKLIRLDNQITEIVPAAEGSQVPREFKTDWSIAISNQSLLCKYWAVITRGVRNRIDTTSQAVEIYCKLPHQLQAQIDNVSNYRHRPTIRKVCRNQLRTATRYQKQLIKIHRELRQQGLITLQAIRECENNEAAVEVIRRIMRYELHTQDLSII